MRVAISSAHALYVPGAKGLIDENRESRRVVAEVVKQLRAGPAEAATFDDNASRTVAANINAIVGWHNAQTRDLDVSIHFNAHQRTHQPRGTETLYLTGRGLEVAAKVSKAISDASGLRDRGAKRRTDLGFLNRTQQPAILIEVCFVDSTTDVRLYQQHFATICAAIANALSPVSPQGEKL